MKRLFFLTLAGIIGTGLLLGLSSLSMPKKDKNPVYPVDSAWMMNQQTMLAVLYQQKSGEYRALCYQAYEMARMKVEKEASNTPSLRPRAIILDIDETVLDNSPYQAECILKNKAYPELWNDWCLKASAKAVPGAAEFLRYTAEKGVEIFYITNRDENQKEATLKNLQTLNIPAKAENLIMKTEGSGKEKRRKIVEAKYQVVLYIGDNLNDFTDVFEKRLPAERMHLTDSLSRAFGKRFIMLPNAMYGDWESALFEYQYKKNAGMRVKQRFEHLQGF